MTTELTFRELVENSGDVFIVVDKDFTIRYISSSVEKVAGVKPITLLGKDILEFVDRDKSDEYRRFLGESKSSASSEIELELQKGVKTYFDVFVSNVSQENGEGSISLRLHDITAKKIREEQLMDSNRQLDQVIYKTTHDLKAPLTSALGLIHLAEKAPLEEKDEYIALIRKSLVRLNGFIEEINHFFRSEKLALKREKIDLKGIIEEELENVRNLYQTGTLGVDVKVEGDAELYSDMIRLRTIITNLVTNAIKYADREKENPWIKVYAYTNSEQCLLMVEDNGIGIEEEYESRVFDLFFRATTQSSGTGIGLFIVKDTVDRLQGSIELKSTAGIGTSFMIKIPNQLNSSAG